MVNTWLIYLELLSFPVYNIKASWNDFVVCASIFSWDRLDLYRYWSLDLADFSQGKKNRAKYLKPKKVSNEKKRKNLTLFFMFNPENEFKHTFLLNLVSASTKSFLNKCCFIQFLQWFYKKSLFPIVHMGKLQIGQIRHFPGMKRLETNVTRLKILSTFPQIPCSGLMAGWYH